MTLFEDLANQVIEGNAPKTKELTERALREGSSAKDILENGLLAGMKVVGEKFKANEYYIPEVLMSARAVHTGLALLEPLLAAAGVEPVGIVVIGTVRGDLHDIGKNLVAMMLRGAGFRVIDLGVNVTAQKFIEAVREHNANILAMSALLTTTVVNMKEVIDLLKSDGYPAKVLIGGAPVTEGFARQIGADGYSRNASLAVETARRLVGVAVR
jgi:5-methyltetrahydrofolate--homocysteine methyltransferase